MRLKAISVVALALFSAPAIGQEALKIDATGNVSIPGKLTTGELNTATVNAGNLDQTLKDLMDELKSVNAGLKSDIAALKTQIDADTQWTVYADTVSKAFGKVSDADLKKFEFGVMRNGGFRKAHFSTWNRGQGRRLMTEAYMTGDGPYYVLGGSVWTVGGGKTFDSYFVQATLKLVYKTADEVCGAGNAYHMYYKNTKDGVKSTSGNKCNNGGPVFARLRRFN